MSRNNNSIPAAGSQRAFGEPSPDNSETDTDNVDRSGSDGSTGWSQSEDCVVSLTRSNRFSLLVAMVILTNTFAMALEADYPDLWIWLPFNHIFIAFFVVELIMRLYTFRAGFFCDPESRTWNMFDLVIVTMGVIDLWVLQTILNSNGTKISKFVTTMRVVRILRILRVLRLLKQFKKLALLARGLIESVHIVFWISVLLCMILLVSSIFCTNFIGHRAEIFEDPEEIRKYWGTIHRSATTLFQFLTMDDWSSVARTVTEVLPGMQLFFVVYIVITAFAILSLLTGVMAEHMTQVSEQEKGDEDKRQTKELEKLIASLYNVFRRGDRSGDDLVSLQEFQVMLDDPEMKEDLQKINVKFMGHEPSEMFEILDTDGDGYVSWEEFKIGL